MEDILTYFLPIERRVMHSMGVLLAKWGCYELALAEARPDTRCLTIEFEDD